VPVASLDTIRARIGEEIGASPWIEISQEAIDRFADVTGDRQFIHIDPEAAARTPFGGTVAHGFLTLSLLSQMAAPVMLVPDTTVMAVNYGFERVRFVEPVPSGARVRGRFTLRAADLDGARLRVLHTVTVDVDGRPRPALTADWIGLIFLSEPPKDTA